MQRILSEEEYQKLANKADKFDEARKAILQSIKTDSHSIYATDHNGMKVVALESEPMYTFNIDLHEIFKSLEINMPSTMAICFTTKNGVNND